MDVEGGRQFLLTAVAGTMIAGSLELSTDSSMPEIILAAKKLEIKRKGSLQSPESFSPI